MASGSRPAKRKGGGLLSRGGRILGNDAAAVINSRDPYAALQTLRSLLEGIGSPKKPMSPEEHQLTLRLLDIVEPFVGSTPAKKNLVSQPNEILDEIVFHIDSKRDLLAFALTCERMYRVIHPRHYEYRVIRAKISSISVWQHLTDNKALARGVRRLEVMDERSNEPQIVPSDVVPYRVPAVVDVHKQHEEFFMKALDSLPTITSFVWGCTHSPVPLEKLWDSLVIHETLQHIEIMDNLAFNVPTQDILDRSSVRAPSLKSVEIKSSNTLFGAAKNPTLERVSDMLVDRCPNLEDLHVRYDPRKNSLKPRANDFLSVGRWSKLRSLTLRSFWCSNQGGVQAIGSFLADHPNLETLTLDLGRHVGSQLILPPDTLPKLRELTSSRELATAIMMSSCAPERPRPLEVIKGVGLSGPAHDQAFFDALRLYDIKRIELSRFNDIDDIRSLVGCVPKLTWLDVGMRCNYKTGPLTIPNAGEWAIMLSQCPDLVAFHGIHMFYDSLLPDKEGAAITQSDRSRVLKNNETANVLAWKLRKLRRLDHWEDGSGKIIVLLREGDKVRWEVRRVKG